MRHNALVSIALSDVLDLRPADARRQWERVLRRQPRPRQEAFLPVELVLTYGLFFVLDPHAYGGRNIDRVPSAAKAIAKLVKRTPGSITSKMLNLDGSRANCARVEPELFAALSDPERFSHLYDLVLRAARNAGIGPRRLPDFLAAEDVGDIRLIGQDEIGTNELDQVLREHRQLVERLATRQGLDDAVTTRLVEQAARLGQHRFARQVLEDYDHRCGFCGFAPTSIRGHRMLNASHVKPWRDSTHKERLDRRNGIAACPVHDAAFDTGLLTVNGGLRIHRSRSLGRAVERDAGADRFFGESAVAPHLVLGAAGKGPARRYLDYHREHIFVG